MTTASLRSEKQVGFYQNKVNFSLTFIQRPETKYTTVKWSIRNKEDNIILDKINHGVNNNDDNN